MRRPSSEEGSKLKLWKLVRLDPIDCVGDGDNSVRLKAHAICF